MVVWVPASLDLEMAPDAEAPSYHIVSKGGNCILGQADFFRGWWVKPFVLSRSQFFHEHFVPVLSLLQLSSVTRLFSRHHEVQGQA